jgi:SAM-dependent methyltransferase
MPRSRSRSPRPRDTVTAFDSLAAGYDAAFTDTALGRRLRQIVWTRLDPHAPPGTRALELNCGTGEDASHLASLGATVLATDIAPAMVAATASKAVARGVGDAVVTQVLAIERIGSLADAHPPFDLVLSNFGGVNCVADLDQLAADLALLTKPGGVAVLCVMGPVVPWEWAWELAHARPANAVRRLRRGGASWRGLTIRYPSIATLRASFAASFRLAATTPVGIALPPSQTGDWFGGHRRLGRALDRAERVAARIPGTAWLADHYVAEFVRR